MRETGGAARVPSPTITSAAQVRTSPGASISLPTRPPPTIPHPRADFPRVQFEDSLPFIPHSSGNAPPGSFTTAFSFPSLRPPIQPQDTTTSHANRSSPPISAPSPVPTKRHTRMTGRGMQTTQDLNRSVPGRWTHTSLAARFNSPGLASLELDRRAATGKSRSGG
jgi:hypothetical protein